MMKMTTFPHSGAPNMEIVMMRMCFPVGGCRSGVDDVVSSQRGTWQLRER